MAKLNEKYEAMVVFSLKNDEEQIKALVEKFSELIKTNGTLTGVDEWGKRKLAYEINYEDEGYYLYFRVEARFPRGIRAYRQHYRRYSALGSYRTAAISSCEVS